MRKIVSACLCMVLILGIVLGVCAAETFSGIITYDGEQHDYTGTKFKIYVNGERIETPIPPIVLENGRSLVPVREICEALGADVLWTEGQNSSASTIIITKGRILINLTIDEKKAKVNGVEKTLETAPKLIAYNGTGKTMVPIRFVTENLGMDVEYKANEGKIIIKGNMGQSGSEDEAPGTTPAPEEDEGEEPDSEASPRPSGKAITSLVYSSDDGVDIIDLSFSKEPGEYSVIKLTGPVRLAIDFDDFDVSGLKSSYEAGENIKQIRTGNYEGNARIVFDVDKIPEYSISVDKENKSARIKLKFEPDSEIEVPAGAKTVVIDAGHGGSDPGALGKNSSGAIVAYEKDINLAISKKLVTELRNAGVNAVYTRSSDVYWTLEERITYANKINADLFVSIHCNALEDTSVSGTLVMHHTSNAYSAVGQKLAANVLKYLPDAWGLKNRGRINGSTMYVISKAKMPSVIVENAFITNAGDRAKLKDNALQQKAAEAIAKGILDTINSM